MKIIQIVGDNTLTGVSRHVVLLSSELIKKGHRVEIISAPGPVDKYANEFGIKCTTVKMGSILDRNAYHKIRKIIKKSKPDLVHCHGVKGGWLGRLAVRKLPKIAVVYTEHYWTKDFQISNAVWREFQLRSMVLLDQNTDATIALSKTIKNFMVRRKLVKTSKPYVIPLFVREEFIQKSKYIKPDGVPRIIGLVGSLNSRKGYLGVIEALYFLNKYKKKYNWQCQIIGSGPMEKVLNKKIKKYKLDKKVSIIKKTDSILNSMRHFAVFIQNSSIEPFSMVTVEAMSLGIPVIVSNKGALPEIIDNKKTGQVVPFGKQEKLAAALYRYLNNNQFAETIGNNAKKKTRQIYSAKTIIPKIESVYFNALKTRKSRII